MKKFLILTVSVLFVSCPVGPSIPTEALFCITGKTKGTARIEAVGGNTATELFSVTADGEAVRLDSNELAFSSESSFYKVRYIDNGSRKGIEYPTGFRIVLPDDGNGVEIAVLTGREVRDFPEKQRVEINDMAKVFMTLSEAGKTDEAWTRLREASAYDKDRRYTQTGSVTRTWEMTFREVETYRSLPVELCQPEMNWRSVSENEKRASALFFFAVVFGRPVLRAASTLVRIDCPKSAKIALFQLVFFWYTESFRTEVFMGEKITMTENGLRVPANPVIPFIEGDGIGPDIWKAAQRVFDAAVEKAYGGERKVEWLEVLAGEKAFNLTGEWLPKETEKTIAEYLVGIKGPLTTPVGGGIRSLNVALRQLLDLYVCLRPVRYYAGIDTPVKHPEAVDMVIFRENTEDVYAGFETKMDEAKTAELIAALESLFGWKVKADSGIGIKPISRSGTERLVKAAIDYAIAHNRKSVTLVHKGNIMKFTEGAFRDIGYETAEKFYGARPLDGGPWRVMKNPKTGADIVIKDVIADAFLQQILTRPAEYDVIATMNLNGDYISDALAAQVGGIGIAPGANINYITGTAVFEATHGTAPKYAGQDKVNPCSLILSVSAGAKRAL